MYFEFLIQLDANHKFWTTIFVVHNNLVTEYIFLYKLLQPKSNGLEVLWKSAFWTWWKFLVSSFELQTSESDQITVRKIRNYVVDYPHGVIVLTFFSKAFWSKWDYEHTDFISNPAPISSTLSFFERVKNCKSVPFSNWPSFKILNSVNRFG